MKKIFFVLFLCIIIPVVAAEDSNVLQQDNTALIQAIADMQQQIQLMQEQLLLLQQQQPSLMQLDDASKQLLQNIDTRTSSLEQDMKRIDETLFTMKTELMTNNEITKQDIVRQVNEDLNNQISNAITEVTDNTRLMTNPIRINLPNFALWLMLTSAFMIGIGLKRKKFVKRAEKEEVALNG